MSPPSDARPAPRGFRARLRCRRGQAAMEFALVLPVLMVFMVGVLEFGHAYEVTHAVTGLSREGANLAGRGVPLEDALAATLSNGADLQLATRGGVVASRVLRRNGGLVVDDQVATAGYQDRSRIGREGGAAAGLGTITLSDGQIVFVVEVFYEYQPITPIERLTTAVLPEQMYGRAVF